MLDILGWIIKRKTLKLSLKPVSASSSMNQRAGVTSTLYELKLIYDVNIVLILLAQLRFS